MTLATANASSFLPAPGTARVNSAGLAFCLATCFAPAALPFAWAPLAVLASAGLAGVVDFAAVGGVLSSAAAGFHFAHSDIATNPAKASIATVEPQLRCLVMIVYSACGCDYVYLEWQLRQFESWFFNPRRRRKFRANSMPPNAPPSIRYP